MNGLSLVRRGQKYKVDNKELKEEIARLWEEVTKREFTIKTYAKEITKRDNQIEQLEIAKSSQKLDFECEIDSLKSRLAHSEMQVRMLLKEVEEWRNESIFNQIKKVIKSIYIKLFSKLWRRQ